MIPTRRRRICLASSAILNGTVGNDMMNKAIQIGVVMGLILSAGCATMESRIEASPKLYPATRMDLSAFRGPFRQNDVPTWMPFAMLPVAILDMPFSLVSDTLLFPYDLYRVSDTSPDESQVKR